MWQRDGRGWLAGALRAARESGGPAPERLGEGPQREQVPPGHTGRTAPSRAGARETRGERAPALLAQRVHSSGGSLPRSLPSSSGGRLPPAARAGPGGLDAGADALPPGFCSPAPLLPQVGGQPSLLRHGEAGLPAQQQRPSPQHHRHGHLRLPDGCVLPAGPGRAGTLVAWATGLSNLAPPTGSKW